MSQPFGLNTVLGACSISIVLAAALSPVTLGAGKESARPHAMQGAAALLQGRLMYTADNDERPLGQPFATDGGISCPERVHCMTLIAESASDVDATARGYLVNRAVYDLVAQSKGTGCATEAAKEYGLGNDFVYCCANPQGGYIGCLPCAVPLKGTPVLECYGQPLGFTCQAVGECVEECPDESAAVAPISGREENRDGVF
jgi:hypothetical protein